MSSLFFSILRGSWLGGHTYTPSQSQSDNQYLALCFSQLIEASRVSVGGDGFDD
jgi:hypothetical protein